MPLKSGRLAGQQDMSRRRSGSSSSPRGRRSNNRPQHGGAVGAGDVVMHASALQDIGETKARPHVVGVLEQLERNRESPRRRPFAAARRDRRGAGASPRQAGNLARLHPPVNLALRDRKNSCGLADVAAFHSEHASGSVRHVPCQTDSPPSIDGFEASAWTRIPARGPDASVRVLDSRRVGVARDATTKATRSGIAVSTGIVPKQHAVSAKPERWCDATGFGRLFSSDFRTLSGTVLAVRVAQSWIPSSSSRRRTSPTTRPRSKMALPSAARTLLGLCRLDAEMEALWVEELALVRRLEHVRREAHAAHQEFREQEMRVIFVESSSCCAAPPETLRRMREWLDDASRRCRELTEIAESTTAETVRAFELVQRRKDVLRERRRALATPPDLLRIYESSAWNGVSPRIVAVEHAACSACGARATRAAPEGGVRTCASCRRILYWRAVPESLTAKRVVLSAASTIAAAWPPRPGRPRCSSTARCVRGSIRWWWPSP